MPATRAFAAFIAAAAIGLAGCTSEVGPTPPDGMVEDYTELASDARESRASEEQVAVLELALSERRTVTFEEYKTAKEAEIQCVEDLGFEIIRQPDAQRPGWIEIDYLFGGIDASDDLVDLADGCMNHHSNWVEMAYMANETIAERDIVFDQFRDQMLACLEARNVNVPTDTAVQDILVLDREATTGSDQVTCSEETGLAGAL